MCGGVLLRAERGDVRFDLQVMITLEITWHDGHPDLVGQSVECVLKGHQRVG